MENCPICNGKLKEQEKAIIYEYKNQSKFSEVKLSLNRVSFIFFISNNSLTLDAVIHPTLILSYPLIEIGTILESPSNILSLSILFTATIIGTPAAFA